MNETVAANLDPDLNRADCGLIQGRQRLPVVLLRNALPIIVGSAGSILGGILARQFFIDGIVYGAVAMALIALQPVRALPAAQAKHILAPRGNA